MSQIRGSTPVGVARRDGREDGFVDICGSCGRGRDDAGLAALAWVHEPGPGGGRWVCPDCARRHVRDIEAKLAPEWWARDT